VTNGLSSISEELCQPSNNVLQAVETDHFLEYDFVKNRVKSLTEVDKNAPNKGAGLQEPNNQEMYCQLVQKQTSSTVQCL